MDSERPPRKARKSMRSQGKVIAAPNVIEPVINATVAPVSNIMKRNARKSIGTFSRTAGTNKTTQLVQNTTRSSVGISQDTTVPLSQPSCSRDNISSDYDLVQNTTRSSVGISQDTTVPLSQPSCSRDNISSDYDTEPSSTRSSVTNSLNSTMPLSKPGCSKDPDSSDSDISSTPKIPRRKSSFGSKTSKKPPVDVSSSSSSLSTSEESEVEELLKKQAANKLKAQSKAENSLVNCSNLINQCVFYILVANRSKKAIKKRDIIQNVFEGRNTNLFPEVLKKAAAILQKIFGFELMELKSNKNEYLLVNNLFHQYESSMQEFAEYSRMEHQKQGFVFYILTLIFMNENSIMEEELWKALEPLGIEIKLRKPHPIFGDLQKFVTVTLVKQMYLERRQLSKDPPQYELHWGERAHKEVLKEDLLAFVCTIMPDTKPEEWRLQYKDAKGEFPEGDAEIEAE